MKYIDSEKITAKIDGIIDGLKRNSTPDPMGTTEECLAAAEIEALELVKSAIDEMMQEEPASDAVKAAIEYCGGNKGADARVRGAFVTGSQWKEQQMMKQAIEGKCMDLDGTFQLIVPSLPMITRNMEDGDKVKVIIIKED